MISMNNFVMTQLKAQCILDSFEYQRADEMPLDKNEVDLCKELFAMYPSCLMMYNKLWEYVKE